MANKFPNKKIIKPNFCPRHSVATSVVSFPQTPTAANEKIKYISVKEFSDGETKGSCEELV